MKKKEGSSLIFAILLLSFFVGIALTMFVKSRNKSKQAIYKLQGLRKNIEDADQDTIINYEIFLANKYVDEGKLYRAGTPYEIYIQNNYNAPIITTEYGNSEGNPNPGFYFTGVILNTNDEYFSGTWDPSVGDLNKQPWVKKDIISYDSENNMVITREWDRSTENKVVKLHDKNLKKNEGGAVSIGGYRIVEIEGDNMEDEDGNIIKNIKTTYDSAKLNTPLVTIKYEKIISIESSGIRGKKYKIIYIEKLNDDQIIENYIEIKKI